MTTAYPIAYAVSGMVAVSETDQHCAGDRPLRQSQFYQFVLQRKVDGRP